MEKVSLSQARPEFKRELAPFLGGATFAACYTCRTCSASCPVAWVNAEFNPLRIIRMAFYGLKDELLKSDFLWYCTGCYTCQERCPQEVRITDFILELKNLAYQAGLAPSGITSQNHLILGAGRIYAIDDFDNKKRTKAGLPALLTANEDVKGLFPEAES